MSEIKFSQLPFAHNENGYPAPEEFTRRYEEEFELGNQAFDRGDYAEAHAHYLAAWGYYEKEPVVPVELKFNLAMARILSKDDTGRFLLYAALRETVTEEDTEASEGGTTSNSLLTDALNEANGDGITSAIIRRAIAWDLTKDKKYHAATPSLEKALIELEPFLGIPQANELYDEIWLELAHARGMMEAERQSA
jgi:tetratricopeptide (TPR) repeat protein